jgi:hypothetical protein
MLPGGAGNAFTISVKAAVRLPAAWIRGSSAAPECGASAKVMMSHTPAARFDRLVIWTLFHPIAISQKP